MTTLDASPPVIQAVQRMVKAEYENAISHLQAVLQGFSKEIMGSGGNVNMLHVMDLPLGSFQIPLQQQDVDTLVLFNQAYVGYTTTFAPILPLCWLRSCSST